MFLNSVPILVSAIWSPILCIGLTNVKSKSIEIIDKKFRLIYLSSKNSGADQEFFLLIFKITLLIAIC